MRGIWKSAICASFLLSLPVAASAQGAPTTSSPSDEAARLTEARAIMAIRFPPEDRDAMFSTLFGQARDQIARGFPANLTGVDDPGLNAIMEDFRRAVTEHASPIYRQHAAEFVEALAAAYAREFSLDELKALHDFARTPAGRHYLSSAARLAADPAYAAAYTAMARDIGTIAQADYKPFAAKLDAYLRTHPEVNQKLIAAHTAK